MTYFYFHELSNVFFESEEIVDFSTPTPLKRIRQQVTGYTQIMSSRMAERFKWCMEHVKQFSFWYEGHYEPYTKVNNINFWYFIIPDPEEAIMFKLRWNE